MTDQQSGNAPKVKFVTIDADQQGQRIDNFLITALKSAPKSLIYRVLRKGEVRVNKKRIKPEYKIQAGDVIRIPPVRLKERGDAPVAGNALLEYLESAIIYESDALLVINKPSGLAVHGGSGVNLGLIEAVRQMREGQRFLELVHRIDRDTSGCIMIAKKRSMLRHLHQELRERKVHKTYHALVQGRWERKVQRVDAPLFRDELRSGERIVRVDQRGKESVTDFRVLRRFGDLATLIQASPKTGRTHQIRVHTQFTGHPIIGDPKYCSEAVNEEFREKGIRRLMLHAAGLNVTLPDGEKLTLHAPMDSEIEQKMLALGETNDD